MPLILPQPGRSGNPQTRDQGGSAVPRPIFLGKGGRLT
jgi:hypothetical protein